MQRLALFTLALAASAGVALPASAQAPGDWYAGAGTAGDLIALRAVDGNVALAGGFGGVVMETTDAGRNWAPLTPPGPDAVTDLDSRDGGPIYALQGTDSLARSDDAGTSWTHLGAPAPELERIAVLDGGRLLVVARRSLQVSDDGGATFRAVTPTLSGRDSLMAVDSAPATVVVCGPHTLLVSSDAALTWRHLPLPALARGDSVQSVDFVTPRSGLLLTNFRDLWRTADAGRHWRLDLANAGAGANLSFSDPRHGWLSAPGFANRFDGYVLRTIDGGTTWRPQRVASRFVGAVAAAGATGYAIATDSDGLFATGDGGEGGRPITTGFRTVPRRARRDRTVQIRGRIVPAIRGAAVVVSMRSAGRWTLRYVHANARGVYVARFKPQRRAWFVAQVPAAAGHGSAATKAVYVPVAG